MKALWIALLFLIVSAPAGVAQISIRGIGGSKPVNEKKTKTIHGIVKDQSGKPVVGARVIVVNTKDNTTRTLVTDETGTYSVRGLAPEITYEVRADFKGAVTDRKTVSALLDREDNLVNFQLESTATAGNAVAKADSGPELQTFDLVKLKASFESPTGVPAPIPAVLLLHGFGEDRKVWEGFRTQLLAKGWAVMSLDLRGHGDSKTKNQRPIAAVPEWRSSSQEFVQDVGPALDWLKKQTRLDSRKIVVIGYDVGANLALISSGRFPEVKTVVAVKPVLKEALEMAGSAQDFHPRSALVVAADPVEADPIKNYVTTPVRSLIQSVTGGTAQLFQSKPLTDAIFLWLKETY